MTALPTLIARTVAGDGRIVRDELGREWLQTGESTRPADAGDVSRAIREHGWIAVDQEFPTWAALDSALESAAAEWASGRSVPLGFENYDVDEANHILDVAAGQGPVEGELRTVIVARRLLGECPSIVRGDPELFDRVRALVLDGQNPVIRSKYRWPPPGYQIQAATGMAEEVFVAAFERIKQPAAA